jgi:hypothetical protein
VFHPSLGSAAQVLSFLLKEAAKKKKTYKCALLAALGSFIKEYELDTLLSVLDLTGEPKLLSCS